MNVQVMAAVASVGALGGLFLGVGLPVLQEPETVAPITVQVPVTEVSPSPRERDDGKQGSADMATQDDDRDDRSRRGPVSGDGDDDDAADDGDD